MLAVQIHALQDDGFITLSMTLRPKSQLHEFVVVALAAAATMFRRLTILRRGPYQE
jgi:hypothetical protein